MIRHFPSGTKIWLVAGINRYESFQRVWLRKYRFMLKDDPMSGHVFIFRGRSGSQVKLLWSTGDGLCLLTKRLERKLRPSARCGKVFLYAGAAGDAAGRYRLELRAAADLPDQGKSLSPLFTE